jgi:predicted nucleic acid-binding protein
MMNYLLDSSAVLAFYFGEAGGERVQQILSDDQVSVRLSVLTMAEFWSRLRAEGSAEAFTKDWREISELMTEIEPVSMAVVRRSLDLREAARSRLPHIDALIAATAALNNAVLVHRDPHFLAIPGHLLRQESLTEQSQ